MSDVLSIKRDRYTNPLDLGDMAEYEKPQFSRREIERSGRVLRGVIPEATDEALEAFRVAYNWRAAHMYPMHRVRRELVAKARRISNHPITAARLKRMHSIRRKLRNQPYTLYQLQDIGGCRVVLDSLRQVNELIDIYRSGAALHKVRRNWPYIEEPKTDGYRSHHIVFKFSGDGEASIYNRQSIEVQFRTNLQHAWATAVEAVGLVRNENLKNGEGSPDWLRFFAIMSSEIAISEGCPTVPGVTDNTRERRQELRELERQLQAIKKLESYGKIIQYADKQYVGNSKYFLIQYDLKQGEVTVSPQFTYSSKAYWEQEERFDQRNTVLVEVDKIEDLKAAFPNYFLDVRTFAQRLRSVVEGRSASPWDDFSWVSRWNRPAAS